MSDTMRAMMADAVAIGLQQSFPNATITKTETTSGCPLVRIVLASGDRFNITITRSQT